MNKVIAKGIDVSSNNGHGTGNVDFDIVKRRGYDFAIIRVGYSTLQNQETGAGFGTYVSKSFALQMKAAQAAGLDLGVYWYSKAFTPEQAREEAHVVLNAIKPYKLAYPVAFDMEHPPVIGGQMNGKTYKGLPKAQQLDVIDGFMEALQDAGYYGILYMSASPLAVLRQFAPERVDKYDCWPAQYYKECTYPGEYGIWQHHGDIPGYVGQIAGVEGPIDLNDCYRDYPEIMRAHGLNGFPLEGLEKPIKPAIPEAVTITREQWNALFDQLLAVGR